MFKIFTYVNDYSHQTVFDILQLLPMPKSLTVTELLNLPGRSGK